MITFRRGHSVTSVFSNVVASILSALGTAVATHVTWTVNVAEVAVIAVTARKVAVHHSS